MVQEIVLKMEINAKAALLAMKVKHVKHVPQGLKKRMAKMR